MKKAAFYTLGCRSNQYETEILKTRFSSEYQILDGFKHKADLFIVNTCLVTHDAERKSRQAIRRALREGKKVIVTGCYAKLRQDEIKKMFPEAALDFARDKWERGDRERAKRVERWVRVRANLMIENGCENFCAYCIVPYARGRIRSKPPAEVLKEAEYMVSCGVREIILTGINLGAYQHPLPDLIKSLSKIKDLLRIRLSSIEPMYLTNDLIDAAASLPKACEFFHIPLQSGDDQLLKAMGRNYTSKDFEKIISRLRKKIPECGIGTDIIAGLPGEDQKAFNHTLKLVDRIKFSNIHIFPYSKRAGTPAALMPNQVDPKIIRKRTAELEKLRDRYAEEFRSRYINREVEILVEKKGDGLTGNFIRVAFDDRKDLTGRLHKVLFSAEKRTGSQSP